MSQIAYYLRTSHYLQNIGTQIDKIEDGWKVYEDKGVSGRIPFLERPSGKRLIEDIAKELNKNQSQNHAKEKISQNIHEKRNLPSTHVKNSTAFNKFDFLLLITLVTIIALMLNEKEVGNLYNFILNLKSLTYESIQEGIMSLFSKSS